MIIYLSILFIIVIANIYAITLCINIKGGLVRLISLILISICLFRYFSLYAFFIAQTPNNLYLLKNMIFTSAISLPIVSYIFIKIFNNGVLSIFDKVVALILAAIYIYLIYKAPYGIESAPQGYRVVLNNGWPLYISIIQGAFSAAMIYLSLNYFLKSQNIKYRIVNLLYFLGYIAAAVEGIMKIINFELLPSTVIGEMIIIIAIIMTLKIKPKLID